MITLDLHSRKLFYMRIKLFILVVIASLLLFSLIDAKRRKGKLKIGKKVKRLFVPKKHHKKSKPSSRTTITRPSISKTPSSRTLTTPSLTLVAPTETTFSSSFTLSDVLITITDRNYNYFYGYATNVAGVNFYNSPKFLVAGPQQKCACCDNKIIIVTKAPDDRLI
jgi:hypothetical protein